MKEEMGEINEDMDKEFKLEDNSFNDLAQRQEIQRNNLYMKWKT